jgi:UDP-glucose 4-epimerase
MSRSVVTGGAGFIGSHLVEALVARGDDVVVYDSLFSGRESNLASVRDRIEFVRADVRDLPSVAGAIAGADHVFHLAAVGSVPRSVADPETTTTANVMGTLNVLMAARDAKVRRVVFASSSSAYGEVKTFPQVETMVPAPLSPYAASKVAGELYCRAFLKVYGLETVSLRYFNVFGPRQDPNSQYAAVIPRFATAILEGRRPTIYGDGKQSRDFCFVENVVRANLLAAEAPGAVGGVFNIACSGSHDLLELLDRMMENLGRRVEPVFEPPRPGDPRRSEASIAAASEGFGYRVFVDFAEGIRRTTDWYRGQSAAAGA